LLEIEILKDLKNHAMCMLTTHIFLVITSGLRCQLIFC